MLRWDRRGRLEPLALQSAEAAQLLADMPESERMASFHLVDGNGTVVSAGEAIAPLMRLLPGGGPFAALAERMPKAAARTYRSVAAHRSAFGRLVTAGAKRRAGVVIAAHSQRGAASATVST
jgi:predicted DCC family thiol-disulfide oxidoreductase YuxK